MRRLIIILTAVFFLPGSLLAVTPGELATRAERSYAQGRYDQAIADWRNLLEIGFVNGAIYNNLGSAYWREGKVGLARLHFLKAQALQPRNAAIRENLDFTENPTQAQVAGGPLGILKRIPFYRLSLNGSEALTVAAVFSFLLFLMLFLGKRKPWKAWNWAALGLLLPFFWGSSQTVLHLYQKYVVQPAVLIAPRAELLANPVTGDPARTPLPEGTVLRLIKKQGDFYRVKTLEGEKGWLPVASVGVVG
jgi:tetratricopeptide (TPR) repeat protein